MLNLIKLENRIVLDGAGAGEAADHAADQDAVTASGNDTTPDHPGDDYSAQVAEAAALLGDGEPDASEGLDIVLVSDSLPDYQKLVDAAKPGATVIVYDASAESAEDVISRVTDIAKQQGKEVNSLTLLSHGGAGYFLLGNETINSENINEYSESWAALDDLMKDEGHIYVYGCNVVNGSGAGQSLLDNLAEATTTSVYASDDYTGKGGDWDLEAQSENAQESATPPLDNEILSDYSGVLTTDIPLQITVLEDNLGSYQLLIYGPGENQGSQDENSIILTGYDTDAFTNATLQYDGWVTDQPRVINGETITEYHQYTVRFDPAQDVNQNMVGSADIHLSVVGEGTTTTEVTILPVNDAPEFTKGADQVIDEDSPAQTIVNWATGIRPGPVTATDEAGQNLDFIVTNDNNALFLVQPYISDDGTLRYTAAAGMSGVANVTVTLKDDGGTEYGGQDTSAPQQFTITVTPVNDPPDAPEMNDMTYVENHSPTHLDVTLGTDPDDTHLSKAEISIVGNYQPGEDVLNYTTINGITGSWDASTGTLTLTGDATIAQYQQAIRSVTYGDPANDNPTEGNRTIRVTITDANSSGAPNGPQSSSTEANLFVDAVNDAPDLEAETGELDYDEDSGPQAIDPDFELSDVDDENMTQAVIKFDSGYNPNEDVLAFTNTGNITGTWDAATGTLTLTGLASKAAYEAALRSVTYENTNTTNPDPTSRQISITIRDNNSGGYGDGPNGTGGFKTDTVVRTVEINALPDPPNRPLTDPMVMTEDSDNPDQINADGTYGKLPNDGEKVSDIVRPFKDPDTGQMMQSIAITDVDNSNGIWQYSLDGGNTWTAMETETNQVSETNALLLGEDAKIRFVPNADFNTRITDASEAGNGVNTPTLTIKSWNQSAGSEGQYVNTANDPAFSTQTSEIKMGVLAVNDQPDLDVDDGRVDIEDYRKEQAIDGITTTDIDLYEYLGQPTDDTGKVVVTLKVDNGIIDIKQTDGLDSITGNETGTVVLKGELSKVQAAIDSMTYEADESKALDFISNGDVTQPFDTLDINVNDLGNYGQPHERDIDGEVDLYLKNLAPDIDLDPDDSGSDHPSTPDNPDGEGVSPNFEIIYIEQSADGTCPPVRIADYDALITDADSEFLHSLTITLTNKQEGDQLAYDNSIVQANGLKVTETEVNGQVVLRFEGQATTEAYSNLLRSVTFANTSDTPSDVQRVINVEAADLNTVTGGDGNVSQIVTSTISVVPVNDAPDVNAPDSVSTLIGSSVNIDGINSSDVDVESGELYAILTVEHGTISVESGDDQEVSGNGTRRIVIQGKTIGELNALLSTVKYTPLDGFEGEDKLTVTVNDQGNTGVNPNSHVTSCNTLNEENIKDDTGKDYVLDENGQIPSFIDEGTRFDPSAQIGQAIITIRVRTSDPEDPTSPENPTGPPLLPITKPDAEGMGPIGPGLVKLPGPVGATEGSGLRLDAMRSGGRDVYDFCSIEDALRVHLGCRFANTIDPEAKFSAVSWAELGWERPFLDEEYDLYRQLFLKEANDPGFNVPAETFDTDLGGLPAQSQEYFADAGPEASLNDMEGGEIKEAFFKGRENLDKTWR